MPTEYVGESRINQEQLIRRAAMAENKNPTQVPFGESLDIQVSIQAYIETSRVLELMMWRIQVMNVQFYHRIVHHLAL